MSSSFEEAFGQPSEASAEAPGRVNLIGEHTDYNEGFVLPAAIALSTRVQVARRRDDRVEIETGALTPSRTSFRLGEEARSGGWADYVMAVTALLRDEGLAIGGFGARVESTVPLGSGLSSSAALLVALLRAMRGLFGLVFDDVTLARFAHRAEHDFVGAPVGIMDQMVVSLGDTRTALFLDTRSLTFERIALPAADLVVIDSGVHHEHASGGYRARREECEAAARALGVRSLRDVDSAAGSELAALPAPLDRRARHVVTENDRVLRAVKALKAADLTELGLLFDASHRSMRDDFEVSVPEVDDLVESARNQPGVYGARMTGGGFGGSIIALARPGHGAHVARVALEHALARGRHATRVLLTGGAFA